MCGFLLSYVFFRFFFPRTCKSMSLFFILLVGKGYAAECFINLTEVNLGSVRISNFQERTWESFAYPVELYIDCRGGAIENSSPVRLTSLVDMLNGYPNLRNTFTSELTLRTNWQGISAGTALTSSEQWLTAIKSGLQQESYLVIPLVFRLHYKGNSSKARDTLFNLVGPFEGKLQWLLEVESRQHIISLSYRGSFTNGTCRVEEQSIDFGQISTHDILNGNAIRDIQLNIFCDSLSIPNAIQFYGDGSGSDFISSSSTSRGIAIRLKNLNMDLHSENEVIKNHEVLYFNGDTILPKSAISIPIAISVVPYLSHKDVSGGSFSVPIVVKFMY